MTSSPRRRGNYFGALNSTVTTVSASAKSRSFTAGSNCYCETAATAAGPNAGWVALMTSADFTTPWGIRTGYKAVACCSRAHAREKSDPGRPRFG